jgi:hypothetical protein
MTCGEATQVLMDMVLDEAGAAERERVEAHLARCEACRAEMENLKLTRKLLVQGLPQEEVPRRIAFVAPSEGARPGGFGWLWSRTFTVPLGAAAAIVLVAAGLALAHARLVVERGHWEVAFGSVRTSGGVPGSSGDLKAAATANPITREQAQEMVAAAVRAGEQRQQAMAAARIRDAVSQSDKRHWVAVATLGEQMRYFEQAQSNFSKEADRTRSDLQFVASRLPAKGE